MKIKLQTRITLIYSLIFTMVLFAMNAAVYLIVRFYNTSSDNLSLLKTRSIVESVLQEDGTISQARLEAQGVRFPMVVLVTSARQNFSSVPGVELVEEGGETYMDVGYLGEQARHRAAIIRTEFLDNQSVSYHLIIAKSVEESAYTRRVTLITTSIASFLGMLLSIAVGSYMSHESFKPITNIRRSVESINALNMSERIKVPDTGDELTDLGNTFNSLLERMETAYQKQSKFVSDASHELRTPLTVMRGYVDLLDRWGKSEPEILEESIQAIKEETQDMTNLVENLLFIARGENRKLNFEPTLFNLMELVEEVSRETMMNQPDRNIEYSGESFDIVADERMLKQLLRVFIENSEKFTSEGGTIRTTVSREGRNAVIKVWDNGDGIAPADMERVFERFYVADKARTKDKSGSGLGLSIARWIVDVHGGRILLDSKLDEYTEFTVILPLNLEKAPDPGRLSHPLTVEDYEARVLAEQKSKRPGERKGNPEGSGSIGSSTNSVGA